MKPKIRRQAARTDAAAARVEERSEYVALNVSRTYIDYLLQQRLVAIAQDNVTFHENLAGDLREGVAKGSISIADQQQAEERLQAARARVTEAREDLDTAGITFRTLTGIPIDSVSMPPDLSQCMPASLEEGEATARQEQSAGSGRRWPIWRRRVKKSAPPRPTGPKLNLEGRPAPAMTSTVSKVARATFRRSACSAGRSTTAAPRKRTFANSSAAPTKCTAACSSAPAAPRKMCARPGAACRTRRRWSNELEAQSRITDDLLLSYREQFNIGRRSLLDVLDAQNTRYNVQAQAETAQLAKLYAQYRVLAAENRLIAVPGRADPARGAQGPDGAGSASIRSRRRPAGRRPPGSGDGSARSGRRNACRRGSPGRRWPTQRHAVEAISTSEDG